MKSKKRGKTKSILTRITILILIATILITVIILTSPKVTLYATKFSDNESFNLIIEVPEDYRVVEKGKDIWFTTRILNLANRDRMDITLIYEITDSGKEVIVSKSETVAIETQASFVKSLKMPEDIKDGKYNLNVKLYLLDDEEAQGSEEFYVGKKGTDYIFFAILLVAILAGLIILFFIFLLPKIKKYLEKNRIKNKIQKIIRKRL